MSFCSNCGAQIEDDASFCAQCGTPVAHVPATEASAQNGSAADAGSEQPVSAAQPKSPVTLEDAAPVAAASVPPTGQTDSSAPQAAPEQPQAQAAPAAAAESAVSTEAPQAQAQPQPQAVAQPQPQAAPTSSTAPQAQQVYAKGCVSAAWSDVTGSKGWFGKVALMALINFIPILNWIIPGYCMRWSRQLVFGQVQSMPKSIFCNRAFINGVFAFVIGLVISVVLWICNTILGFIPFLGWIAIIVLSIFAVMFEYLCYMRAAIADSLGAGFQISKIWDTFTRNLGSLFCAAVLPNLIIGIIVSIVIFIIFSIGMVAIIGGNIFDLIDLINSATRSSYYSSSRESLYIAQIIFQIIFSMIPVMIICIYVGGIGVAIGNLLTFRAMGHWVSRYAPDWATDPAVTVTAHMYDPLEPKQQ